MRSVVKFFLSEGANVHLSGNDNTAGFSFRQQTEADGCYLATDERISADNSKFLIPRTSPFQSPTRPTLLILTGVHIHMHTLSTTHPAPGFSSNRSTRRVGQLGVKAMMAFLTSTIHQTVELEDNSCNWYRTIS